MHDCTSIVSDAVLMVENLEVSIRGVHGSLAAVSDLTFGARRGETIALVGESGCGKSLTALSLMRLLPEAVEITGGRIVLQGTDLTQLRERSMKRLRGSSIAMIFQDPMTSLNPLLTIGGQIGETLRIHDRISRRTAEARAQELLEKVGVSDAPSRLRQFPHELSGGMRQRVMIAAAMAGNPRVMIADEPTTALDVTVQAQILALLRELQRETGMALVLITHDFGVVAQMADHVAVMYAGRIVEQAPVGELFAHPLHPYTQGLLGCSRPGLSKRERQASGAALEQIPGTVRPLVARGAGCAFADRCSRASAECRDKRPTRSNAGSHHEVECWHTRSALAESVG